MKKTLLLIIFLALIAFATRAQTIHEVRGVVQDTTGATLPGTVVRLASESDTLATAADVNGVFIFPKVKAAEFRLTISLIGFQPLNRRFLKQAQDPATINVGIIQLKTVLNQLKGVTIVGVNPVTIKEDTVDFKISAYKVREGAPVEDALRKMPGVDVDKDGNITAQGKAVQRVRVNGKDYFGGDVRTATQNLPADVIESAQIIDDYGDQANLTGIRTGEPDKILNLVIRKDRNKGYFGNATVGAGRDALPSTSAGAGSNALPLPSGNATRYLATLNANIYNNEQQIAVIGNLNNTNINTFTFSGNGSGQGNRGGGGNGGFNGGGGGGGRNNAARFGAGGGSATTNANGININRSLGLNYRDEWGKKITVYGSYSFSNRTTNTLSNQIQDNLLSDGNISSTNRQNSNNNDDNLNHRFNFNLEYRPDTLNYLKVTPTFSYSKVANLNNEDFNTIYQRTTSRNVYNSLSDATTTSPNYGASVLFNHRFKKRGRNFSFQANVNKSTSQQDQSVDYTYQQSTGRISPDQSINVDNVSTNTGLNFSYLEPVSKKGYLELNYAYNHSYTKNTRLTDTLRTGSDLFDRSAILSNDFNYTFTTNRVGLNYRFIDAKYNYTLGFGVQPSVLDGVSPGKNVSVRNSTFNYVPTARFIYNFSRTQALTFNYNGNSNQPSFTQLQPVPDLSNAQFPVEGNPNLNPEFSNNFSLRYNKFSFSTGDILLANVSVTQTADKVVTNTINIGANPAGINSIYSPFTTLTRYRNANGYYTANAFLVYAKPFSERKYTVSYNGNLNYSNNVGFIDDVENIGKNWAVTNGVRFRINLTDIMETELNTNYTFNNTNYTLASSNNLNAHIKTTNISLNGKNYFWKNWTLGYDLTKTVNRGYVGNTNPFLINTYVERRFLKQNKATIRLSGFDLLKQNIGQSISSSSSAYTQTTTNRLSRYFLLSFNLRLQKFAGRAPNQNSDFRGEREGRGGRNGGGAPAGGPPGAGGPPMD
ncbi:MAG: hypothetical protein EOP42_10355 [Sphingobacteriaceae bacterium]|nr:MAG: hypothetical protein EOP42_10355 [Sphingobacteriaceae bacterium]